MIEAVSLLTHVRLLDFDFTDTGSQREAFAIWACGQSLRSGDAGESAELWRRLVGLAAERRRVGGSIDLPELLAVLRSEFQLKDRIDHAADWGRLDRRSEELIDDVSDSVAGRLSLLRQPLVNNLWSRIAEGQCILLGGEGGTGKSALAKRLAKDSKVFARCVWLDAAALDHDSMADVERYLGISVPLPQLFSESATSSSCVVFDGLETFSPRALARASVLLRSVAPNPAARGWVVLATTRPHATNDVRRAFHEAGVSDQLLGICYVEGPTEGDCATILGSVARLDTSLVRRELRAAMRHLKLLDWIIRDAEEISEAEVSEWHGVSHVVDSLWRRWVGTGAGAVARAGVMKRLASLEGEGLQHGVGTSRLQAPEHAVLPELERRELLRVKDERIWFRHDVLGDWSRLRVLIEEAETRPARLPDVARFPRWHDAIRLYGQRLLESDRSEVTKWMAVVDGLRDESPSTLIARDMLLEALFTSTDASHFISKAWATLCEDRGVLLRRLFKRFLYTATVPDPRLGVMVEEPGDEDELSPHLRVPWGPLWPGFLEAVSRHEDDVARLAPIEAARVSSLWLRSTPVGTPGREYAAQLAVTVAREVQAGHAEDPYVHGDRDDKVVFEALLNAAGEFPEAVSSVCLELSRRRPDPPHVVARAKAHAEHQERERTQRSKGRPRRQAPPGPSSLFFGDDRLREQFPDGPAARVDEGFQRTVLDGADLLALAVVRPDVAREVLLACALEAPRPLYFGDSLGGAFDTMGVTHDFGASPPMFFRGPWLTLLRYESQLGIDCIVRLVNQASLNWEAACVSGEAALRNQMPTHVSLQVDAGPIEYTGDMRAYGWYRERLVSASVLVSALMALEKWFYEELEQERSIDDAVMQILRSSRSIATLGVLVAVGKLQPQLFTGPLMPLLRVWQLYGWDARLNADGDVWQVGFFQWAQSGERVFDIVRTWHTMPHRKEVLRDQVILLLLSHQEAVREFATIRAAWKRELESGQCVEPDSLELLIARFDPSNYERKPRDDQYVEIGFQWPADLREKTERHLREASDGSLLLYFPIRCRQLLDAGIPLPTQEAESVWTDLQRIAAMGRAPLVDRDDFDRRPDAILGGVAVLAGLAPEWLSEDRPREEWWEEQLSEVLSNPPRPSAIDSEHSVSTDSWHSFKAEIAVVMFSESPNESGIRAFAADAVASSWYATTGVALRAAYRRRHKLGAEFNRLVNLAVCWAALRCIQAPERSNQDEARMMARRGRLIGAFRRREIPTSMMNWTDVSAVASRARDRLYRKHFPDADVEKIPNLRRHTRSRRRRDPVISRRVQVGRVFPGIDIEGLRHGFGWLPTPSEAASSAEREQQLTWLSELLAVSLRMLPDIGRDEDTEIQGAPYQYDSWVFKRVATAIAQMTLDEDPGRLWRPILERGPVAHYWIKSFLGAWTVSALQTAPSAAQFFERWREMIEFATRSPIWMPVQSERHFRLRELWEHLLGMHFGASIVGADGHQRHFSELVPLYRVWGEAFLNEDRSVRAYCRLLNEDGARPLLCPSVPWLLQAAKGVRSSEWRRNEIADEIAGALRRAWVSYPSVIATDEGLLSSFSELLNLLVTHQSSAAMDLRDKVSRSSKV